MQTNAIKELVSEFPYCQTLQLLYVKQLHLTNHFSFNQQLKVASVYAGDRIKLYGLIHNPVEATEVLVNSTVADFISDAVEHPEAEFVTTTIDTVESIESDVTEPIVTVIETESIANTATAFVTANPALEELETVDEPDETDTADLQKMVEQPINELTTQNNQYDAAHSKVDSDDDSTTVAAIVE